MIRWVAAEPALIAGGGRALLLQLAHPKVAQGVADHSGFEDDPLPRLAGTLGFLTFVVWGTPEEAERAAKFGDLAGERVEVCMPAGCVARAGAAAETAVVEHEQRSELLRPKLEPDDRLVLAVEAPLVLDDSRLVPDEDAALGLALVEREPNKPARARVDLRLREPPPEPRPLGQGLGIVLMRRLIDCVLIHHDHRGTNVLLRHPVLKPAPDRSPGLPSRSADRATGAHRA